MKSPCDNSQKMPWSSSEEAHLGFSQQESGRRVSGDQPQKQQELGAEGPFGQALCFMSTAETADKALEQGLSAAS